MKNIWKKLDWKKVFKWSKLIGIIYILVVIARSIYTYSLSNGEVTEINSQNPLENYYLTFGHVKEKSAIYTDSNGVYMVDYSKIKALGVENHKLYNPITIGLNALRSLQRSKENKDEQDIFLANADWLVENQEADGSWLFPQDVKIGSHTLEGPWVSGLSQGLGISVLVRAHHLTQNEIYIETAREALTPFTKTLEEGGVTTHNDFGICYEEYTLKENPTHVLNGFIYALYGLNDLAEYDNNALAEKLFQEGADGLKNSLDQYDTGSWTKYSLNPESTLKNHYNYASPWYQKLHANQIRGMSDITGDEVFQEYAERWDRQKRSSPVNLIIYPAYAAYTDLVALIRMVK